MTMSNGARAGQEIKTLMRRSNSLVVAVVFGLSAHAWAGGLTSVDSRHYFVLDMRGDGFDLSGANQSSGTRWTKVGTDDAFLAADATGLRAVGIDISNDTRVRLDGVVFVSSGLRITADGQSAQVGDSWQMLSVLDTNRDGKVDSKDLSWNHLRIFVDRNGDGSVSQSEIRTPTDTGIREIGARSVGARKGRADAQGNTLVEGSFTRNDGSMRRSADVTFARVPDREHGVALR